MGKKGDHRGMSHAELGAAFVVGGAMIVGSSLLPESPATKEQRQNLERMNHSKLEQILQTDRDLDPRKRKLIEGILAARKQIGTVVAETQK